MKILMLMPEPGRAGAAKVFEQHCKDFSIFAIIKKIYFSRSSHLSDEKELESSCYLDDYSFTKKTSSIGRFVNRVLALRKISRYEKADIIISHLDGANYVNAACPASVKKILVVHGTTLIRRKSTSLLSRCVHSLTTRILYNKADYVVPVSRDLGDELKTLYKVKNVKAIHNYLDIEKMQSESSESIRELLPLLRNKNFKIVSHGRLVPNKNLDFQIDIIEKLKEMNLDVSLVLVGDGIDYDRLVSYCRKKSLSVCLVGDETSTGESYDVYFIGFIKNPYPVINFCDLFMLTSKFEGFPLSICEAMSFGLPVIAANCPTGPKEILHYVNDDQQADTAGVLLPLPANNSESSVWAESVSSIITDNCFRLELKRKSLKRFAYFSKDVVVEEWKAIINGLGGQNADS